MSTGDSSVIRDIAVQDARDGPAVVVRLVGDVDLHHSPEVRTELLRLAAERHSRLIVDLSQVDYMDSSGVASLVEALQQVRGYKGRLMLAGANLRVRSIFQIARLDTIFQMADSLEEALAQ